MADIKRLCVYCGSSTGYGRRYAECTSELARELVKRGIGIVYGGAMVGLMGTLADTALELGGDVVGVVPSALVEREVAHDGLSDLRVVESMHARKSEMAELSDGFVALPGGIGTLEELVEQLTWQQLGRHSKPILLADIDGFWAPFVELISHMRTTAFIRPNLHVDLLKADRVEDILPRLRAAAASVADDAKQLAPDVASRL